MDLRPIGVFDSGLGGVSTLRQAMKLLPTEDYYYYGDCANAPYGGRTEEDICALTLSAARHIASHNVKALLIACNTATAAALSALQAAFSIPVIGIQPAIAEAAAIPGNGSILMLATRATTRLPAYLELHAQLDAPERVINIGCPEDIVRNVEAGVLDIDTHMALLDTVLRPYRGAQIDSIVLGCTHYPFIQDAVKAYAAKYFSGNCAFFEGGMQAVTSLEALLTKHKYTNPSGGAITFETSGNRAKLFPVFQMLLHS